MQTLKPLALFALALTGGCAMFEPTPNWWVEGGRLCAASRTAADHTWDRPTPRSCVQVQADASEEIAPYDNGKSFSGGW